MKHLLNSSSSSQSLLKTVILSLISCLLVFTCIVSPVNATGVYELPLVNPGSSTWIVDSAEVISLSNEGQIGQQLKQLAKNTGNEVRMVVIRRLDFDETIDSFADKLFDKWYPTPEEKANQTLVAIETLSNNATIRTGENSKPLLTEDILKSVISQTIAYPLREGGKYNQALVDTSRRLVAVLSGKPDPGPPEAQEINIESTFTTAEDTNDVNSTIWVIVLLTLATLIPMVTYFWYVGFPSGK